MIFKHCPNCAKKTGHKRAFGAGTVIGFFFTLGLWLLVMPFYPLRCTICGMDTGPSRKMSDQPIAVSILLVLITLFALAGHFVEELSSMKFFAMLFAAVFLFRFMLYEDRSRQRSREKLSKPGERANPIKLRK